MQFLCSIWKILHLTEYFYTGTAHGARNNYQVCTVVASTSATSTVRLVLAPVFVAPVLLATNTDVAS